MKKIAVFLSLISFIIFLSGCNSNNKQTIDSSTSTNTSSFEVQKSEFSKDYLIGKWTSTEEDWPIDIEISEKKDTKQLQLDITAPEDSIGTYTATNGYSSYSNSDNSVQYNFSLNQDKQLMMVKTFPNMKANEVGAVRGWFLDKVED